MGIQSIKPGSDVLTGAVAQGNSPVVSAAPVAQAATQQSAADQSANLEHALKQIEVAVQAKANNLQYSVDDSSGKTVVRVIDSSSGNTIRQIPSEEALAIANDIERMQGLLLRDSA
jgi:flagellar protein FlaG